jgi:hypothetical protein
MVADPREGRPSECTTSEEGSYYAEVEKHFVGLRGSPLFITPQEWQLIHNWRQMGIPLRVVEEGVNQVFERRKPSRRIRRLSYCRQKVEAAYRRHCEALAGAPRPGGSREESTDLQSHLHALENALKRASHSLRTSYPNLAARVEHSAERLVSLRGSLAAKGNYQEVESELNRMDEDLVREAETCLVDTDRRHCMDEALRSLRDYQERMPEQVYDSAVRSAYLKRVRAQFGLPALSLFYI